MIQPTVIILGMLFGFNYTRGQQAQVVSDTANKIDECKTNMKEMQKEQGEVNKELLTVIQDLKVAIAELKIETRILNSKRGKDGM